MLFILLYFAGFSVADCFRRIQAAETPLLVAFAFSSEQRLCRIYEVDLILELGVNRLLFGDAQWTLFHRDGTSVQDSLCFSTSDFV